MANCSVAENVYQDGLRKFPDSFELRKASGRLLASMKRYERAADDLAMVHAGVLPMGKRLITWGSATRHWAANATR